MPSRDVTPQGSLVPESSLFMKIQNGEIVIIHPYTFVDI